MFDSPFDLCSYCGEVVLLDQTKTECAREHRCSKNQQCPLQALFTGIDFSKKKPKGKSCEQKH